MAPVVCGLAPWGGGALGAYCFHVGADAGPPETPEMEWGRRVEGALRDCAAEAFGPVEKPLTRFHAQLPWLYATPDGRLADGRGLELKNVGPAHAREWGAAGTDEVPDYVNVQCQTQMCVFGFSEVVVGASLCGAPPDWWFVPRHDGLIADLVGRWLGPFWLRVVERRPPDPDWNDAEAPRLVALLRPPSAGLAVDLPAAADALAEQYRADGESARAAERRRQESKGRLIEMMAGAETGRLPGGGRVVRKTVARKGYAVAPTSFVDFHIFAPKKENVS
jgi:hypothetical protein